ncbi:MAG: hypothetical protein C4318_06470 [Acidimicrobiia bacterium]
MGVVVVAAVAVGTTAAMLISRSPRLPDSEPSPEITLPTPVAGSGFLITDAPTPTPVLQTIPPNPATPAPFTAKPPPASWLEGRYRVLFRIKADSCGEHISPQEHELVVTIIEAGVRVEDTFTNSILEGPGGEDGSFRVESSVPMVPGSRRALRQVMVGKGTPGSISGDYFVYPAIRDCAVQLTFEGPKIS